MPGQSFQQPQRQSYNKNTNNSHQHQYENTNSSYANNPRHSLPNTTRTTPDSGLGPDDHKQQDRHRQAPTGVRRNSYNLPNANYRNINQRPAQQADQQMNRQPPSHGAPTGPPAGVYYSQQQQQHAPNLQYGQHVPENTGGPYDSKGYDNNQQYQGYDGPRGGVMYQQPSVEHNAPYDDNHGAFPIHGANEGLPSYGGAGLLGSGYDAHPGHLEQHQAYRQQHHAAYSQPQNQGYPPNPAVFTGNSYVQGQPYPPQNTAGYRQGPQQVMGMVSNQGVPQSYYPMQAPGQVMMSHQQPGMGQIYVNMPLGIVCKPQQPGNAPSSTSSEKDKVGPQHMGKQPQGGRKGPGPNQHGPPEKQPEADQRSQHLPPHAQGNPHIPQEQQVAYEQGGHQQAPAFVPNPFHMQLDQQPRVVQQGPMGYSYPPHHQQQHVQTMPEHMNVMQVQQAMQYGHPAQALMQSQISMPPQMTQHPNQMHYPPNSQPQQYFGGRGRPEPLMNVQQNSYMYPVGGNGRHFANAPPPGMGPQGQFARRGGRGGGAGGSGRGAYRGGNPDGRGDHSLTHSRQNSGQSHESARSHLNYVNNSYRQSEQSHNIDPTPHNLDDDMEHLTNKVELLEPVRGSRNGSPSKQVLELIDEKKQNEDLAVETTGQVEIMIDKQKVVVETQVSDTVDNARRVTPPTAETVNASEEETGADIKSHVLVPARTPNCIRCANHASTTCHPTTHNLRDEQRKCLCPELRKLICRRCGKTGDDAHDEAVCPDKIREDRENQAQAAAAAAAARSEEAASSREDSSLEREGTKFDRHGDYQQDHDQSYRRNSESKAYEAGRGGKGTGGGDANRSIRGAPKYGVRGGNSKTGAGSRGGGGSKNYDDRRH